MAKPIFFSYAWTDSDEADVVDTQLRLRGVPVWRDRRAMRWGNYSESTVREAIDQVCTGFVLYLTQAVFSSDFIKKIELDEMQNRERKGEFFAGAIFRHLGFSEGSQRLRDECEADLATSLGTGIASEDDFEIKAREAAGDILRTYLRANIETGPVSVRIETRDDLRHEDSAVVHLAWSPPLAHDPDQFGPEIWGSDLLPALEDLRRALDDVGAERRLKLRGNAHLSAALALGYEFRQPTGWTIELEHESCPCETELVEPDRQGWRFTRQPHEAEAGGRLVVCLHASQDVGTAMSAHGRELPPARAEIHVYPPDGEPGRDKVDAAGANQLAAAIAKEIRDARQDYKTVETHLYLACPWPMALLLGWHLASSGILTGHESTVDRDNYRSACRLD